jgi:hypothetical protein
MRTLKVWYFGTMFLVFGWLFDAVLYVTDDLQKAHNLLRTCLYYGDRLRALGVVL